MNQTIDPEVRERLGLTGTRRRRWRAPVAWIAALALLVAGVLAWRSRGAGERAPRYVTAPAEQGDLTVTVTATGTLRALDTVEVGSEVSGRVLAVHADFNDRVAEGQVLATLDPEQARARADEAAAQVAAASAGLLRAQATAAEAQQNLERAQRLAAAGVLSSQELDTARATAQRSSAEVASARAQASVAQASLVSARSALEKTAIRSPIDGVVLSRTVEPGQTVAASLQAPVLFTLARDLSRMTLHVDVDEADVGKVREGQPATFTVDAYPGREFASRVVSLRNVAKTDQNVVTYEAVLAVENPSAEPQARSDVHPNLLLRPGMTATAMIQSDRRADVLLVPNAALRFTPPEVAAAEGGGPRGGLFIPGVTRGNPWRRPDQRRGQNAAAAGGGSPGARQPGAGGAAAAGGGARRPEAAAGQGSAPGGPGRGGAAAGEGSGRRPGAAAPGGPGGAPGGPGVAGRGPGGGGRGGGGERVWVLRDGEPEAVYVTVGATDGQRTEVAGPLRPGDEVIVDLAVAAGGR